jgi:hypothetical protein
LVAQTAIQISQNLFDQNILLNGSIVLHMWALLTSAHLTYHCSRIGVAAQSQPVMTAEADALLQNLKQHGYVVFQLMTPNEVQAAKQHVYSKCSNSNSIWGITSRVSNPVLGTSAGASTFKNSQHHRNDMQISKGQE